jgi:hypothetical protein
MTGDEEAIRPDIDVAMTALYHAFDERQPGGQPGYDVEGGLEKIFDRLSSVTTDSPAAGGRMEPAGAAALPPASWSLSEAPTTTAQAGSLEASVPSKRHPWVLAVGIAAALVLLLGGGAAGYMVGRNYPAWPPVSSSTSPAGVSASNAARTVPATISPAVLVPIPMDAACEWAYPGQSTGTISGTAYSITCLGLYGRVLGGFSGVHSLNAWCADPGHTDGKQAPSPALIDGVWECASSSADGGQVSIPIPIGAACEWAYQGRATGAISGSGHTIVCLGPDGQALGGFSGSHSLNAWCADPSHTNGEHAFNPTLIGGAWVCIS